MNNKKELQYRKAKQITTIRCIENEGLLTPLCPTCNNPIFIEYTRFCPYCGQKLSWNGYEKIEITYI